MIDLSQFDIKGLNTLHEVIEPQCQILSSEIEKEKDTESIRTEENMSQLNYLLTQLQRISEEINKRRAGTLVYSIEDVYKYAAQSDKYTIFRFYRNTNAYKEYGEDAYGFIIYKSKKERETLEEIVSKEKYERNDGIILVDGACKDEIKLEKLRTKGFSANEVMEVLTSNNFPYIKQFKKEGIKEIPNTLTISIDTSDFDAEAAQIYLAKQKLKKGYKLLEHELIEFYSNQYVLSPDSLKQEEKEKYLFIDEKGTLNDVAQYFVYRIKYRRGLLQREELVYFGKLMRHRLSERLEIVKKELGISAKQLQSFKESHPEKFDELSMVLIHFDTEALSDYKTEYPVYWDFERFIHIHIRHYSNFFIPSSTYKGTHFQYTYKDIRRLACLVINNLQEEIEARLSAGKNYEKYSDKGYYFNGNFYTIRISNDGKLVQFHPLE